jgi:hypothetical protein
VNVFFCSRCYIYPPLFISLFLFFFFFKRKILAVFQTGDGSNVPLAQRMLGVYTTCLTELFPHTYPFTKNTTTTTVSSSFTGSHDGDLSSMYYNWLDTTSKAERILDSLMQLIQDTIHRSSSFSGGEDTITIAEEALSVALESRSKLNVLKIVVRDVCLPQNQSRDVCIQFSKDMLTCGSSITSKEFLLMLFTWLLKIESQITHQDKYYCQLTLDVMVDPVTIYTPNEKHPKKPFKNHYERSEIERWFGKYKHCNVSKLLSTRSLSLSCFLLFI